MCVFPYRFLDVFNKTVYLKYPFLVNIKTVSTDISHREKLRYLQNFMCLFFYDAIGFAVCKWIYYNRYTINRQKRWIYRQIHRYVDRQIDRYTVLLEVEGTCVTMDNTRLIAARQIDRQIDTQRQIDAQNIKTNRQIDIQIDKYIQIQIDKYTKHKSIQTDIKIQTDIQIQIRNIKTNRQTYRQTNIYRYTKNKNKLTYR